MKKKFISYLKYYSNIVFPTIICLVGSIVQKVFQTFSLADDKIELLVSVSASFIGVLLTILTIYLAIPKNAVRVKQLKESKHQYIYLSNLAMGIVLLFVSIASWLFFDNAPVSTITFIASMANMAITIYYTFSIIKIMES